MIKKVKGRYPAPTLPASYDESLSYMEGLSRTVDKVNEIADQVNEVEEQVDVIAGRYVKEVNGKSGNVLLTKSDVGLGNVNNTSDKDKPISDAAQAALNLKQNITDNSLTTTDKTVVGAINEINSDKADIDLGITGARVGSIAKVAAVDGNGAPTSWGSVSDYNDLQLIREKVLAEELNVVNILEETDGYSLKRARVIVIVPAVASPTSRVFFVRSYGGSRYFWRANATFPTDKPTLPIVDVTVFDKYTQTLAAIIPSNNGLYLNGKSQGVTTFANAQMQYQSQYGQRSSDSTPLSDEPPITTLQVGFATDTHMFPIGTTIKLWGVRA